MGKDLFEAQSTSFPKPITIYIPIIVNLPAIDKSFHLYTLYYSNLPYNRHKTLSENCSYSIYSSLFRARRGWNACSVWHLLVVTFVMYLCYQRDDKARARMCTPNKQVLEKVWILLAEKRGFRFFQKFVYFAKLYSRCVCFFICDILLWRPLNISYNSSYLNYNYFLLL